MLLLFKKQKKDSLRGSSAYISSSVNCCGQLEFEGTVYIEGNFRGDIHSSDGELVIGCGGSVVGNIRVGVLYSSGSIHGDVTVATNAVLRNLSTLNGNIMAPSLVIEDGARIEGEVEAGKGREKVYHKDVIKIEDCAKAPAIMSLENKA